jgi:multidrug efflux pump subunit AcrA (membrane-fusion protein)
MSKTTTLFARRKRAAVLLGLLLALALIVTGCGGEPTAAATAAPTEPPEPTEVAAATATTAPTEPPPTEAPTEAPTEPPPTATATATEEPTPEPIDDSACITCHTDEATLQALATEPEAPEVESEGEG